MAAKPPLPLAGFNEFTEGGGLIGYGADFLSGHTVVFVDKIVRCAKPIM